jgi:MFS family permease
VRWFAVVFIASLASEVTHSLLIHLPGFMLGLGADEVRIGLITGAGGIAALLARPSIGRSMDRYSRRLLIRLGAAALAIACIGYAFVTEVGPLLVGLRVVQGLGDAMTYTAFFTYVADRVAKERRTQGLAVFGISGLAPIAIGTTLGDLLLRVSDYRLLFLVAAGFALLALALSLTLERTGVHEGATPHGFMAVLGKRGLRSVWWGTLLLSLGFTVVFVFVKTYVESFGLGSVGPFFVAYGGAAVVWRLVFGWVPDRLGPARMVAPGMLAYAGGFALLALMGSTSGLVLAGLASGLGHGIVFPVLLSLAGTRAGAANRAAATAVFTAILDSGLLVLGPALGAIIIGLGYPTTFLLVAVGMGGGLWVYRRLDAVVPAPATDTAAPRLGGAVDGAAAVARRLPPGDNPWP